MSEIIHTKIESNFLYPVIPPTAFKFGSATEVPAEILRPDGDWRDYIPEFELQRKNGVESSACYVEAQQHAIATIIEETFDIPNLNFSARFNALLSCGTPQGGSPIEGGDSIRHDGLINEMLLPFADNITSWESFHSFEGGNETVCRKAGQDWLKSWAMKYDIVAERYGTIEEKFDLLKQALLYSPVPISVTAWWEQDGHYIKPIGMRDNHLCLALHCGDDNVVTVLDTYEPFIKKLAPNFPSEFMMRWTVTKNEKIPTYPVKNIWETIIATIKALFKMIKWKV